MPATGSSWTLMIGAATQRMPLVFSSIVDGEPARAAAGEVRAQRLGIGRSCSR